MWRCVPSEIGFRRCRSVKGLRVGYIPGWMKEAPATDVDRAALQAVKEARHEAGRSFDSRLAL